MKRSRVKPKRSKPRRRVAPRFSSTEWAEANALLYQRSGGRCECCGELLFGSKVERHHRQRREVGGDRLANLLLLRADHHQWWTEHPADAIRNGVIVSAYAPNPATVPLFHLAAEWVLLDDDGHTQAAELTTPGGAR